ncbi:MAG: glutamate--tRNA ligase [Alphaproteobacteria bacterium]|nr:glutamate--tRNA ligase [Alphaproteobacteria bacterium]
MSVITRFPPSPTGFMHIGNARTALFNWLYARHTGGKFLVRIEDTDRERYSEEAVQVILNGLKWLELDFDNTPESQFANKDRHIEVAHQLLAEGKAYKCYCTPEELEQMREEARAKGKPVSYDKRWRERTESEAPEGIDPVIRIKAPLEGHALINDSVQGEVKIENDHIDDFVLLRSDGTPTYMLAVVVDDHDMGITHVMRGDDHLNNTFRQNVIYDALGWEQPTYAHLPLIHGPDGKKFSKRHGATGLEEFKSMGYLPEAMRNYLLRLGWSHGDEEIIPTARAVELFDLDGINKAASNFDYDKLESLNAHYIKESDNKRLIELVIPFLKDHHNIELDDIARTRLLKGMDGLKERSKTLVQLAGEAKFYCAAPNGYSDKALKQLTPESVEVLKALNSALQNLDTFTHEEIEQICRTIAKEKVDGKLGKVMMPLRAAITGTDQSPALFEAIEILGKEETHVRIQKTVDFIEKS